MTNTHRVLHSRRRGFTLLEMIIVLFLTALVATLAIPRIDVGRYRADAVVTDIRSVMQTAQRAALVAQYDVIVSFDVSGNRVRVAWDANNDHNVQTDEKVMWRTLISGNKFATPPTGVRGNVAAAIVGATTRTLEGMTTVTFHRDGSLSSDLEIYISTLSSPVNWRAITVVQATGRTDWYRRDVKKGTWSAGAL